MWRRCAEWRALMPRKASATALAALAEVGAAATGTLDTLVSLRAKTALFDACAPEAKLAKKKSESHPPVKSVQRIGHEEPASAVRETWERRTYTRLRPD